MNTFALADSLLVQKEFGKLRQGSGATYFINAQHITGR